MPHITASFVILFILYLQSLFGGTLLILFLASRFTTYILLGWYMTKVDTKKNPKKILGVLEGVDDCSYTEVFEKSISEL